MKTDKDIEREASYFAMCLLIPEHFLKADLDTPEFAPPFDAEEDERIAALAKRYRVSLQLMIMRLSELGYLTL